MVQTHILGLRATARQPAAMMPAVRSNKKPRFRRGAKSLSVESSSKESERLRGDVAGSRLIAFISSYKLPHYRSASHFFLFSSYQATPSPTSKPKVVPSNPLTPSRTSVYCTPPSTLGNPPQCRMCSGPHTVCLSAPEPYKDRLIQVRQNSFCVRQAECEHWSPWT